MIQPSLQSNIETPVTLGSFTLEPNESMFRMLTTSSYKDLISAPIREWSTNAVDACIAAGVPISFDVHLPTVEEPTFSVRDYGTGLPESDIVGLFATLGASTKRQSNAYNGTLGIGRMAGLAYTSGFTVESYHDQMYYSYLISIQNGLPSYIKLGESPTDQPNGLRLSLTVNLSDVNIFVDKATAIYRYFEVLPNLNIPITPASDTAIHVCDSWQLDRNLSGNHILMSNVLYEIPRDSQIPTFGFSGIIFKAPTGSVSFNPGRESLSLDPVTIDYVKKCFLAAKTQYAEFATETIEEQPTPLLQLSAYLNFISAAPHGDVRNSIKLTPSQDLACLMLYQYGSWYLANNHPLFDFKLIRRGYDKSCSIDRTHSERLTTDPFIIVDVNKNYIPAITKIRQLTNTGCFIIYKKTQELSEFIVSATEFTKRLGVQKVYYASEYAQEKTASNLEARKSTEIYVAHHNGGTSFSSSIKAKPTSSYAYLPIKGTVSDDPDCEALQQLHAFLTSAKLTTHQFVGVQQKYLAAVQTDANFVPAREYLLSIATPLHYQHIDARGRVHYLHAIQPEAVMPTALATFFNETSAISAITSLIIYDEELVTFSKLFPLTYTTHTLTHTATEIFNQYPILEQFSSSYYYNKLRPTIAKYLELETFYEAYAHKVNGWQTTLPAINRPQILHQP